MTLKQAQAITSHDSTYTVTTYASKGEAYELWGATYCIMIILGILLLLVPRAIRKQRKNERKLIFKDDKRFVNNFTPPVHTGKEIIVSLHKIITTK